MHRTSAEEERAKLTNLVNAHIRLQGLKSLQNFVLSRDSSDTQVSFKTDDCFRTLVPSHLNPADPVVWLGESWIHFETLLKIGDRLIELFHLNVEKRKL